MKKYAEVHFKANEDKLYHDFLLAMVGVEIIVLSKEQIDKEVEVFKASYNAGYEVHIVLHDEKEEKTFRLTMDTFFKSLQYKITNEPNSMAFKIWLDKKDREKSF